MAKLLVLQEFARRRVPGRSKIFEISKIRRILTRQAREPTPPD